MASMFKQFLSDDKTVVRTPLYESMPMTGTLFNGMDYAGFPDEENIKKFSHGIFEAVYDYPYLSSSANHLFDLSFGFATGSVYNTAGVVDADKKINMYNQMCQMLMGFDENGNVKPLVNPVSGDTMTEFFVINLSRLVYKDELKKGSLSIAWIDDNSFAQNCNGASLGFYTENEYNTNGAYSVDSPTGEYGSVYENINNEEAGMIFYQAGVLLITASLPSMGGYEANVGADSFPDVYTSGSIDDACDAWRHRVCNLQVVNTTELNSTVYFCRANHNEFNYSSNPTYLSGSQIVVKDVANDPPKSYFTGVGLYAATGEMLAVAKLSEALAKDSATEVTLRVRLDT